MVEGEEQVLGKRRGGSSRGSRGPRVSLKRMLVEREFSRLGPALEQRQVPSEEIERVVEVLLGLSSDSALAVVALLERVLK